MDFLDPAKKRQHQVRLLVGYVFMAAIILTITYFLILQSQGYDYDRKTGQIIQNGLVFVSSHPVSANVYANGQPEGKTSVRLAIPSGKYDFILKSNGYREWSTTVNLAGGDIEQLVYPLLVPQKLVTTDVQLYAKTPALASVSLDRHWLLVLHADSLTDFDQYDLTKTAVTPTSVNLPNTLLHTSTGAQSLKAIEWASDNQHILFEHDYPEGKEFIVLDTKDPTKSFNVNSLLTAEPTSVVLHDKKFDQLYAYFANTASLLTVNASSKQVQTVLTDVKDFKTYGPNTVLYSSDDSKIAGQYAVKLWDGQKSYLIHNFPANTTYLLDMAQYSGHTYMAISPVSSNRLYVYKDALGVMKSGKLPNAFIALKIDNPQYISFSANTRFIGAQSGSNFAVYDFENNLRHYFTLKDTVPITEKAKWMDGHRLLLNVNSNTKMFDFNGDNQQVLEHVLPGFDSDFNGDYSNLYSIAPSVVVPDRPALTTTSMVVH